jgi:acetate kinase
MAAAMDGLAALVFTADIGEHDPVTRAGAAVGLEFLVAALDEELNRLAAGGKGISAAGAAVRTLRYHRTGGGGARSPGPQHPVP